MSPVFTFLLVFAPCVLSSGHLDVLYRWRTVEFEFPDHASRDRSIRNREYIPGAKIVPLDVDVWHHGKHKHVHMYDDDDRDERIWRIGLKEPDFTQYIVKVGRNYYYGSHNHHYDNDRTVFVTFPKFQKGIPASLTTVTDKKQGDSYLVKPYPDWSWHSQNNCEKMISVFRTQIDKCGRLWAIDSGMVDLSLETSRRQCNPKLLAFHLMNKQLAGKHVFPDNLLRSHSILTNLAVDVRDAHQSCLDTFVYVSDTTGYSLIVFDARKNKSWKVLSNTMYPYPPFGFYQINGVEFNLMDGILGMALTPIERNDRKLYYHSLASVRESSVSASVLRNENNFTPLVNSAFREFKTSEEARKSQAVAQAFDRNAILYFGMVGDNTLNCWNSEKPFTQQNIHEIARDNTNLQFASGLKIIVNEDDEEEIWILTSRFQLAMVDQMNENEVNFRIIRGKLEELTRNSQCVSNSSITFPNRRKTNTNKPYTKPATSSYGRNLSNLAVDSLCPSEYRKFRSFV